MILYQQGGVAAGSKTILGNIYNKYPKLKNAGEVTLERDTTFTKENTGVGDIEYFSPTQDTVNYFDTGYKRAHPKLGTHGIVYNPKYNDQQSIELDLMSHGMQDPVHDKLRMDFNNAFMDSKYRGDLERGWAPNTMRYTDGYEAYKNNWLDGVFRNLMFEGEPKDFERANYWQGARQEYFKDPKIKATYDRLMNYMKSE